MLYQSEKLNRSTGRPLELAVGYICAAISVAFAALLIWLVYLVAWRNPREHDLHDLFKASTLIIFSILFVIAFGFSVLAYRLIGRKGKRLISPILLRIWGIFFVIGGAVVLIECIANKNWSHIWGTVEVFAVTLSMAGAAFALAAKQSRADEKYIKPEGMGKNP